MFKLKKEYDFHVLENRYDIDNKIIHGSNYLYGEINVITDDPNTVDETCNIIVKLDNDLNVSSLFTIPYKLERSFLLYRKNDYFIYWYKNSDTFTLCDTLGKHLCFSENYFWKLTNEYIIVYNEFNHFEYLVYDYELNKLNVILVNDEFERLFDYVEKNTAHVDGFYYTDFICKNGKKYAVTQSMETEEYYVLMCDNSLNLQKTIKLISIKKLMARDIIATAEFIYVYVAVSRSRLVIYKFDLDLNLIEEYNANAYRAIFANVCNKQVLILDEKKRYSDVEKSWLDTELLGPSTIYELE